MFFVKANVQMNTLKYDGMLGNIPANSRFPFSIIDSICNKD